MVAAINQAKAAAFNPFAGITGVPSGAKISAGAAAAKAYAKSILWAYGWEMDQFPPLDALWTGESGWNYRAYNASSGATGIPQALPGSKMASAGADWRTNPATQIRWGLGYIKGRPDYGSPARAYALWLSRSPHWYAQGGLVGMADGGFAGDSPNIHLHRSKPGNAGRGDLWAAATGTMQFDGTTWKPYTSGGSYASGGVVTPPSGKGRRG